jgi:hypothetical protein
MAGKRILMVEGPDDEHVVMHICGEKQLGRIDKIVPYGGKDPLLEAIGIRLKESDISVLGILLDADTDLPARWQAVSSRLKKAGYLDVPLEPMPEGTIIVAPGDSLLPRVGIWLMPDNRLPGILENFLCFLVPENDPLFEHVEQAIDRIPENQRRFDDMKKPKAKIHTWLAWQDEPGKPLGQAISARYLDPSMPAASVFAAWIQKTFFSA